MSELSQKDQLAFHEFSVQYRKAYAKKNVLADLHLDTFQDAISAEYNREKAAELDIQPEEPSPAPQKEQEPDEPGL